MPRRAARRAGSGPGKVGRRTRAVKAGRDVAASETAGPARALMERGCDHVLIACTELSLLATALPADIPRCDSLDCLSAAIVGFATGRAPAG